MGMNQSMETAFQEGSGVSVSGLGNFIKLGSSAVILLVGVWIVARLMEEYNQERISAQRAIWYAVKVGALLSFLFWAVIR